MSTTEQTTTNPEPRVTVEHSGDGTTATFEKDDLDARAAAKAAGFRWSRNLGAWFLPRTWTHPTRTLRVRQLVASLPDGAVTVESSGPEVTTTAAEREAERIARAEGRVERYEERAEKHTAESTRRAETARAIGDGIPFGQPVLVGHHSQRRHERALDRIHANDAAAWDAAEKAKHAENRAASSATTAAGPTPRARLRRIERAEADLRKAQRTLEESDRLEALPEEKRTEIAERLGRHPISAGYRRSLEALVARLTDEIAHDRAQVDAAGVRQYAPSDIRKGDRIKVRGELREVVRVNRTTVSVATGYSWTDKAPLHQIVGVYRPTGDEAGTLALVEPAAATDTAEDADAS